MYTWLIAIPITLLLLLLAWRRPNRQRLALRLLASAVAGISLTLLVFPPTIKQTINPSVAILLTQGYSSDTLEMLLKQQEAKPVVYTFGTNADDAKQLTDLYTLRQLQPGLQTLHLLGYGLDEQQLKVLEGVQLVPHLSEVPAGVSAVQWPQEVKLGEAITVAGKYKAEGQTKLYLKAAGQLRDSVEIKPDSSYTFSLRNTSKLTGRFVYTLLAKTGANTDTLGQVPVQVAEQQQLSILLLASAPSFEFKFLKNHLGEQQHKIAYRTTVSKNIMQSEWVNMAKTDLSRISSKLLQNFDVVITEPQALQSMSAGERAILQRAVTDDGLGVLTIATAPANSRSTAFFTNFQSNRLSQQDTRNTRAGWSGSEVNVTASPYTLVNTTAVNSLISEQGNNLLAGARRAGWGKVAMSYIPQTFPWQLEGKDDIYASYWSTLLSAIAKEQVKEKFWEVETPQVPQPNKPVILSYTDYTLAASVAAPTATVTSLADSVSINLPLAQQTHHPSTYSGTFWPRSNGWHKVENVGATPYFFYVQEQSDWQFQSIAERKAATEAFVAKQSVIPAADVVAYTAKPVSLIWFFIAFVLSSGFLWLEEKL
ncbi:hypothetical protein ABID22_001161 [Pontibacter aydingkolensis]|uniref:N-terminal double-transmembrane domain-containing protein n=1 Tax=Pontibacter aydingkolensis TaxID=1911536 RepID=A0ABS7CT98_9BACT|nr:hypothetical protein [Pontibacter aydingkolensis]MBW7467069.1 hypothetical protein [Pontibacter aydingkolensis]